MISAYITYKITACTHCVCSSVYCCKARIEGFLNTHLMFISQLFRDSIFFWDFYFYFNNRKCVSNSHRSISGQLSTRLRKLHCRNRMAHGMQNQTSVWCLAMVGLESVVRVCMLMPVCALKLERIILLHKEIKDGHLANCNSLKWVTEDPCSLTIPSPATRHACKGTHIFITSCLL